MRLFERVLKKAVLICFRMISMKIKNVKDLNLKTRWFDDMNNDDDMKIFNDINDNDDMKVVNNMKDLGLKML